MTTKSLAIFFIVVLTLVNAEKGYPERLSDSDTQLTVQQYGRHPGEVFDFNVLLGGNIEKPPFTLGLFVEGNGVYDELQCPMMSEEEVKQLRVKNKHDVFASVLPKESYAVLCKKSEPGSMIVIKDGQCKRRTYNKKDPRLAPSEEVVTGLACSRAAREIERTIPGSHIKLKEDADDLISRVVRVVGSIFFTLAGWRDAIGQCLSEEEKSQNEKPTISPFG
ncbi:uncharacterized protein LOC128997670 [Macrosteles quadrilineatus]|uniref:uncharacterized protein LOC128997670 n=1 Tax=Macrosteles quadrilineatus TaxID=74068 RepID=UPI0023E21404|nr:uncharacterized protein LOC128997670 [Macrosteles quadrilineatus]